MKVKGAVREPAACRATAKDKWERARAMTPPEGRVARRAYFVCAGTGVLVVRLSAIAVASPTTRSCGTTQAPGYSIDVGATPNVPAHPRGGS